LFSSTVQGTAISEESVAVLRT